MGVIGLRQYGDAARRCRPVLLGSARLAFPLEGEPTINAHDFALLELSVVVDQLKDDYPGLTTGSFLVNSSIRVFMLRPSFVFDRDVGIYGLEDDEGVVHLIHIELAL